MNGGKTQVTILGPTIRRAAKKRGINRRRGTNQVTEDGNRTLLQLVEQLASPGIIIPHHCRVQSIFGPRADVVAVILIETQTKTTRTHHTNQLNSGAKIQRDTKPPLTLRKTCSETEMNQTDIVTKQLFI